MEEMLLSYYEARESSGMDDPGLQRYNTWQVELRGIWGSLGGSGRGGILDRPASKPDTGNYSVGYTVLWKN